MDWTSMDFTPLAAEWDPFPVLESMQQAQASGALDAIAMMDPALAGGGEVGSGYAASAPGQPAAPKPGLAPIGGFQNMLQPAPQGPMVSHGAVKKPGSFNVAQQLVPNKRPNPAQVPSLDSILHGRR